MNTPQDELQRLYEEASAIEGGQPAPEVRAAVVAHAAMLAQSRTAESSSPATTSRSAANWPHWKSGLVASMLLVSLLGVLMVHLQEAPEVQEQLAAIPLPHADPRVASKPAAEVAPAPIAPVAPAAPAAPVRAKTAMATAPPPAPTGIVADASPPPAFEPPSMQGALDAAAPAKSVARARSAPQQNGDLLQAAQRGDLQRMQTLLNDGASLQMRDAQGRTLLMLATIGGHTTLVKRLLELGADRAATDSSGLTALQYAQRLGWTEIAALLE